MSEKNMKLMILFFVIISCYFLWRLVFLPKMIVGHSHANFDIKKLIKPTDLSQPARIVRDPDAKEESRMFDQVAKLLFEQQITRRDFKSAHDIQYNFLNKMPARTRCQLNQFELGEWSIIWEFKNQSLEYYVSRYGVFYTHIDANGAEHKSDFKINS